MQTSRVICLPRLSAYQTPGTCTTGTLSIDSVGACDIADKDFEIAFVQKSTEVTDASGPCSSASLKYKAISLARRYFEIIGHFRTRPTRTDIDTTL